MAKSDELVKYVITQRVVHFMDTPKEERKRRSKAKRALGNEMVWHAPLCCITVGREKEKALDPRGRNAKTKFFWQRDKAADLRQQIE